MTFDEVLEARRVVCALQRQTGEERGWGDPLTLVLTEAKLALGVTISDRWPNLFREAIEQQG